MNIRRTIAVAAAIAASLAITGCSSMNAAFDKFTFGKVYAMKDALDNASANCKSDQAVTRALDWTVIGIQDLRISQEYMPEQSDEFHHVRILISQLSPLTSRRNQSRAMLCDNIHIAAQATSSFLVSMNMDDQVRVARN